MADSQFETLVKAETRLSRSFFAAVAALAAVLIWTLFIAGPSSPTTPDTTTLVLTVVQFACYLWYAIEAGAAAKVLGDSGWKYVVWILAAPLLARLPIPIVSTLIGVSPLSIKFLLGSQLQTAIRQEGVAALH